MNTLVRLSCVLLLCSCAAVAQRGHRDPTPQDRNASPDRQLAARRIDPVQVRHDANELAQLAGTVPSDTDQALKGVVVKDLKEKLKRIEKLSKQLRGQLILQ